MSKYNTSYQNVYLSSKYLQILGVDPEASLIYLFIVMSRYF